MLYQKLEGSTIAHLLDSEAGRVCECYRCKKTKFCETSQLLGQPKHGTVGHSGPEGGFLSPNIAKESHVSRRALKPRASKSPDGTTQAWTASSMLWITSRHTANGEGNGVGGLRAIIKGVLKLQALPNALPALEVSLALKD